MSGSKYRLPDGTGKMISDYLKSRQGDESCALKEITGDLERERVATSESVCDTILNMYINQGCTMYRFGNGAVGKKSIYIVVQNRPFRNAYYMFSA